MAVLSLLAAVLPSWVDARSRAERAAERAAARQKAPDLYDAYRADVLDPIQGKVPDEVQILTDSGSDSWPAQVRSEFERRVRSEWRSDRIYGPVHANLGLWLSYPLVTARVSGRVLVPVVGGDELSVRGRLELPESSGPRRVVVLVDASASANSQTVFRGTDGRAVRIPVVEAERRALKHLVSMLGDAPLEVGVIAFGEGTWPIAPLGADAAQLARGLERFARDHPRGEGRTDAVCALWTAYEWLEDTPKGTDREIVLLTDGDLPHSGRFTDCRGIGRGKNKEAREACEARKNASVCPAKHRFTRADGMSDMVQLASFGRKVRRKVRVHPLVFESDRRARVWEQLARRTRGRMVRVPSPEVIQVALPALVSRSIRSVYAINETNGAKTRDLLVGDGRSFDGDLKLAPGANDVELRVESDRGVSGMFRFRVYSEPRYLEKYLARLKDDNESLTERRDDLIEQLPAAPTQPRKRERQVEVTTEELPASPAR